jgi:hypothetical protein
MAIKIHPLGFIIGGNCDRLHKERARRENAAAAVVAILLENKFVVPCRGGWRVGKLPRSFGLIAMKFGRGSADREIAFWRVVQSLLPALKKQKKPFTLKRLNLLARDVQKFTFELGGSLDPIRIQGSIYGQAHYSKMYEQRKKAGHFDSK